MTRRDGERGLEGMTGRDEECVHSGACARRALLRALAILPVAVMAPQAAAHSYVFGAIAVGHIWAPPAQAGEAKIYGSLLNQGPAEDRLIAAATAVAARVEVRFGAEAGLRDFITLPPGKPVSLAPWGYHLRLAGLSKPLVQGERFNLTLTFANAGARAVTVVVEPEPGH